VPYCGLPALPRELIWVTSLPVSCRPSPAHAIVSVGRSALCSVPPPPVRRPGGAFLTLLPLRFFAPFYRESLFPARRAAAAASRVFGSFFFAGTVDILLRSVVRSFSFYRGRSRSGISSFPYYFCFLRAAGLPAETLGLVPLLPL